MLEELLFPGFLLTMFVVVLASMWKTFEKAGVDGWKAIIPIYNLYLVVKIADLSPWILPGLFLPLISTVIAFYIYYKFAENFGGGTLFCILTGIFPFIGLPIIALGDSVYQGDFSPK